MIELHSGIFTIQYVIPFILLAWMFLLSFRCILGFIIQAIGVGSVVTAIVMTTEWSGGMQIIPLVYAVIWGGAFIGRLRWAGQTLEWTFPSSITGWLGLGFFTVLALYGSLAIYDEVQLRCRDDQHLTPCEIRLPAGLDRYI